MKVVRISLVTIITLGMALGVAALDNRPSQLLVIAEPVPAITVASGRPAAIRMKFRVLPGYHVNSHEPGNELLIPTTLKLSPPTDIGIGKIAYPEGEDLTLAIAPGEKLNVYTGEFAITAMVSATRTASLGNYKVHGGLRYQACNDRACFPPREVPITFDVKVVRARGNTHNPPQSPHIHR